MIKIDSKLIDACTGCSACYNICPRQAITMRTDMEGFHYPTIDTEKCTSCNLCISICPELNHQKEHAGQTLRKAFYGWHQSDEVRMTSSSGGIFSAVAESTLEKKGVVFGAIYDKKLKSVYHSSTDRTDLKALKKSKYVQSFIGQTYNEVKANLRNDRPVLFVGTPCQVSGLKSFLQKDVPHLLTCDFICHGVPPIKLLNDHLSIIERKMGSIVENIDFRPKTLGWSIYQLKLLFRNGKTYERLGSKDAYFRAFFQNLSLRKSCYQCTYSNRQHPADLTIADFWGYKQFNPEINNEMGLSLVIANTAKGADVVENSKASVCFPIEWKHASYVYQVRTQKKYNRKLRDSFFNCYSEKGWKKCASSYNLNHTLLDRIKKRITLMTGL